MQIADRVAHRLFNIDCELLCEHRLGREIDVPIPNTTMLATTLPSQIH
jgi:hypothetical protein